MTEFLRPDADDLDGGWTDDAGGTVLYAAVDEASASDTDFIKSGDDPTADVARLRLSNPSGTVDTSQPVTVRYRYAKVGAGTLNLTVRLKEGATVIATWAHTDISATYADAAQVLSSGEKAAVSDWDALFIEFEADLQVVSAWATVTGTTGSPTIHTDVDGDGLWDAYEFTASGSITLTAGKIGPRLWQGGGGSGARVEFSGAGGGGGGWTEQDATEPTITAATYTITVGAGGAGVGVNGNGNSGSTTSAMSTSAPGGGYGGNSVFGADGGSGGNGGGGGFDQSGDPETFGGVGSPGNNGGNPYYTGVFLASSERNSGGGGGSGAAGGNATSTVGGDGGAGITSAITGTSTVYGAGGGGGSRDGTQGAAGGATASAAVASGTSGNATKGSGSGASGGTASGNGGDGLFVIRIRRP